MARTCIRPNWPPNARGGLDNPEALGRKYLDGAVGYLTEEAEKGNVFVQAQLGNAYFFGQYVARDEKAGVAWWRRAAEGGNIGGQIFLGYAAANSRDLPRSDQDAVYWYRLAADRGNPLALANLALHYLEGRGVERDLVTAFMLLRVAEMRGQGDAATARQKLEAIMTADQRAEGERRAAEWKPSSE